MAVKGGEVIRSRGENAPVGAGGEELKPYRTAFAALRKIVWTFLQEVVSLEGQVVKEPNFFDLRNLAVKLAEFPVDQVSVSI